MSDTLKRWWEDITYQKAKRFIRENIQNLTIVYVEIGYFLRLIRDNEYFKEDGYSSVHDFALAEFGMRKSTVNHCIRINAEFSVDGNSPDVDPKYEEFSKTQLQELLYVPEDKRDDVTPDMTVAEIRKIHKLERLDVEPQEKEPEEHMEDSAEKVVPVELPDVQETVKDSVDPDTDVEEPEESDADVIDVQYQETPAEITVESLLESNRKELEEWKEILSQDEDSIIPPAFEMQKIIVQALELLAAQQDTEDISEEDHVQPELPPLKNNEQRKEWLRNYQEWGLWYEDEHIGAKYYRYCFENGAVLIVEEYSAWIDYLKKELITPYFHLIGGPKPDRKGEVPKWQWHETYARYPNSESELMEFLKFVQKEDRKTC